MSKVRMQLVIHYGSTNHKNTEGVLKIESYVSEVEAQIFRKVFNNRKYYYYIADLKVFDIYEKDLQQ